MPRGAHGRGGRPADPNSLRSERRGIEWTALPAAGRKGRVPVWPLPVELSEWGRAEWRRLWRLPQAVEWQRLQLGTAVGLYVLALERSLDEGASAADRTVVLRMGEELGLSSSGMARHRWVIVDDKQPSEVGRSSSSARSRLKLVGAS